MTIEQGSIVSTPPADVLDRTRVGAFLAWLSAERGLRLDTHEALWQWSVDDLPGFWSAIWDYFGVRSHTPYDAVLGSDSMPGAEWFPGARLNYAEHALGTPEDTDTLAVLGRSQTRPDVDLTFGQLREQVARAKSMLLGLGVGRGDRVAGYVPNVPEALVAFLAAASIGATWASCASEFGPRSVVDRFEAIEPAVLIVAGGYRYGSKDIDRVEQVAQIRAELPTVRHVIDLEYGPWRVPDALSWTELMRDADPHDLAFEPVPFDHPLFVLFSSGTTGKPKAIVHGHGGILSEHLKNHALSWDLGPGDRLLWFTTTAWMMWNALVSSLLVRSSLVMVDGNPLHPDLGWQWQLAAETGATAVGVSPGFVMACRKAGVDPSAASDRPLAVRMLGSAGSPLPPEGFAWLHENFPEAIINVGSGGTDVCSGLVQNNPLLPVYAGEISGRSLGVDAQAYDDEGRTVTDVPGELVIRKPMPSMPVGLWGDTDGSRYRSAYFEHFPGVWRHGDWIIFHENGSCVVTGRSDATLNRGGVRLGTAEFYRVVEELDGVSDSLVVHLEDPEGGNGELLLFVVPEAGRRLDDDLRALLLTTLRTSLSPRHIPDDIIELPAIPRNLTGKKLELPVKRILLGADPTAVASVDSLADPTSLEPVVRLAARRRGGRDAS